MKLTDTDAQQAHDAKAKAKLKPTIKSKLSGSWLADVKFDEKSYWDMKKDTPCELLPHPNPLPSDSRFRKDLQALKVRTCFPGAMSSSIYGCRMGTLMMLSNLS